MKDGGCFSEDNEYSNEFWLWKEIEKVEADIPKYKVGDILIDSNREKAIIVELQYNGEYHWKYLEGAAKGIFLDTPFEDLDNDTDYELYIPPKINPRIARLKKRFGFGAENKTTNKVLVVGGIIAGLIGLNKLFGK